MSLISIPNTFSAGAVIVASQHNSNFSTIYSDYNGNITDANISNSAQIQYGKLLLTGSILDADLAGSISYSKLSLTGQILNADLAGSIADTKLNTISTTGKVSGASLTSLSSIPGGAGVIPVANLPNLGLSLISTTTFTADTSKTITGLSTATPYLLVLDLTGIANNEDLVIFPNGTLSTIAVSTNYDGGTNKMRLHNTSGFNPSGTTGSWNISFRTTQGDTTKTAVLVDGCDTNNTIRHAAYSIMDSDTALSSITIGSSGGTMTLTGTAYLYKYATS